MPVGAHAHREKPVVLFYLSIYLSQKPLQNVTFLTRCIVPVSPWQQGWKPVDTEATLGVSCCGTLQENRRQRNLMNRLSQQ